MQDLAMWEDWDAQQILHVLFDRWKAALPCTRIGDVMLSVNPLRSVETDRQDVKVTEVLHRALNNIKYGMGSQNIVIQGESGSGKSTIFDILLRNLVEAVPSNVSTIANLDEKWKIADTLLEAFGSASTPLNDTSSRFAKSVCVDLCPDTFRISSLKIKALLFERSRTVHAKRFKDQTSFLVFHDLINASSRYPEMKLETKFALIPSNAQTKFTNSIRWDSLMTMVTTLLGTEKETLWVPQFLAGILHIGNVGTELGVDAESVRMTASLWAIDGEKLRKLLFVSAGIARERAAIAKVRDTLISEVYKAFFDWLVNVINLHCFELHESKKSADLQLNILDIVVWVGVIQQSRYLLHFEGSLKSLRLLGQNSLEQLLINVTNEELQCLKDETMHRYHQQDLIEEGLSTSSQQENESSDAGLIVAKALLADLDQEARLNHNDNQLCNYLEGKYPNQPEINNLEYKIAHAAGDIVYGLEEMMVKNSRSFVSGVQDVLKSKNRWLNSIFDLMNCQGRRGNDTLSIIAARERSELCNQLRSSGTVHFIMCVKPNGEQGRIVEKWTETLWDDTHVHSQLDTLGVGKMIELMKGSWRERMSKQDFVREFGLGSLEDSGVHDLITNLLESELSHDSYRIGRKTIFMREGSLALLSSRSRTTTPKTTSIVLPSSPAAASTQRSASYQSISPTMSDGVHLPPLFDDADEDLEEYDGDADFEGNATLGGRDFLMNPDASLELDLQDRLEAAEVVNEWQKAEIQKLKETILSMTDSSRSMDTQRRVAIQSNYQAQIVSTSFRDEISQLRSQLMILVRDNKASKEQMRELRTVNEKLTADNIKIIDHSNSITDQLRDCVQRANEEEQRTRVLFKDHVEQMTALCSVVSAPDPLENNIRGHSPVDVVLVMVRAVTTCITNDEKSNRQVVSKFLRATKSLAECGGGGYRARLLACLFVKKLGSAPFCEEPEHAWMKAVFHEQWRKIHHTYKTLLVKKIHSTIEKNPKTFGEKTLNAHLKLVYDASKEFGETDVDRDEVVREIVVMVEKAIQDGIAKSLKKADVDAICKDLAWKYGDIDGDVQANLSVADRVM